MRLRVRKLARAEIAAAFTWYLARSPRAASDYLDAVDAALKSIERAPKRQAIIRGQLRRLLLKGFPYAVYYRVYPESSVSSVSFMAGGILPPGSAAPERGLELTSELRMAAAPRPLYLIARSSTQRR